MSTPESLQDTYEKLLSVADDVLKDDNPLAESEQWACAIDDNLLQLKLWGEAIHIEDGSLKRVGSEDRALALLLHKILNDAMIHLENVDSLVKGAESLTSTLRQRYVENCLRYCA
jgi:hypothetical protein